MKGQLLIAVFLGVIGVGTAQSLRESLVPHLQKCVSELDEVGLSDFLWNIQLDHDNGLRLFCCTWIEAGFFKGAKLDLPKLEEVSRNDSETKSDFFNTIEKCQAESEVSEDRCVVLEKYFMCAAALRHT